MSKKRAIFAFSGDPITLGHMDIITRASGMFDHVSVGIGRNPNKKYLFHHKERMQMAKEALHNVAALEQNINVVQYDGLLVNYAHLNRIPTIVKGVRNSADFDYERLVHQVGFSQQFHIDTCILFSTNKYSHISSSTAKAVQLENGIISEYVPLNVKQALEARLSGQYIIGITGEIGCGKSFVSKQLQTVAKKMGLPLHHIDLDVLGHKILSCEYDEPLFKEVRNRITSIFGGRVQNSHDGSIIRHVLGEIVFSDSDKMKQLNDIMKEPLQHALLKEIHGKRGIILVNAALIAEFSHMSKFCNHNVVVVTADKSLQIERLKRRNLSTQQIETRINSQFNTEQKLARFREYIDQDGHGSITSFSTNEHCSEERATQLLNDIIAKVDAYGELRFHSMWNRIGADGDSVPVYQKLCEHYLEGNRHYHYLGHIVDGVNKLDKLRSSMENPDATLFAWFYHDIIMKQKSTHDEENSALFASNVCRDAKLPQDFAKYVQDLILLTKHSSNAKKSHRDAQIFTDVDLSILGESSARFDEYESDIAREYSWVPKYDYVQGRLKVLESFLSRDHIYNTEHFSDSKARDNLKRSIGALKSVALP